MSSETYRGVGAFWGQSIVDVLADNVVNSIKESRRVKSELSQSKEPPIISAIRDDAFSVINQGGNFYSGDLTALDDNIFGPDLKFAFNSVSCEDEVVQVLLVLDGKTFNNRNREHGCVYIGVGVDKSLKEQIENILKKYTGHRLIFTSEALPI